jgi:hypothetical protein
MLVPMAVAEWKSRCTGGSPLQLCANNGNSLIDRFEKILHRRSAAILMRISNVLIIDSCPHILQIRILIGSKADPDQKGLPG